MFLRMLGMRHHSADDGAHARVILPMRSMGLPATTLFAASRRRVHECRTRPSCTGSGIIGRGIHLRLQCPLITRARSRTHPCPPLMHTTTHPIIPARRTASPHATTLRGPAPPRHPCLRRLPVLCTHILHHRWRPTGRRPRHLQKSTHTPTGPTVGGIATRTCSRSHLHSRVSPHMSASSRVAMERRRSRCCMSSYGRALSLAASCFRCLLSLYSYPRLARPLRRGAGAE